MTDPIGPTLKAIEEIAKLADPDAFLCDYGADSLGQVAANLPNLDRVILLGLRYEPALRERLPGLDALLVLDAAAAGRVIAARPDVWEIIRTALGATS